MLCRSLTLFLIQFIIGSCIDGLNLDIDRVDQTTLVVDGLITNQPGPYRVRLFRSFNADDVLNQTNPFPARRVVLSDNTGKSEEMTSRGDGVYETRPDGIQGVIGRKYSILIEGIDGTLYQSTYEEIRPAGAIDSLYFQWEEYRPLSGQTEYGFRMFLNATGPDIETYLRWKFTGTYAVQTFPEFRLVNDACMAPPDPAPCSGVVLTRTISGGFVSFFLETVGACSCCYCWVNDPEKKPRLNDKVSTNGNYREIEVGYVPFDQWTFRFGKYMVKAEQMSLSKEAFEFWKIIRDQKEGSTSLFQPAFGRVRSNFSSSNPDKKVTGLFYASAVTKKIVFLTASDAPIPVPPPDINPPDNCFLWRACDRAFPGASRTPPPEWE